MQKVNLCNCDTGTLPRLSAEECEKLLERVAGGDTNAREQLVIANVRLVLSVIGRFRGKASSDDLFQVGVVGLMKAIDGFDRSFNVRFSTYAVPMIIGEIRRFIKEETSIKVSRSMRDIAYKTLKAREEMSVGRSEPSLMEVAAEIDVPYKDVVTALDAVSEPISLQEYVYGDGDDNVSLIDQLGDKRCCEDKWIDDISIKSALSELPERERKIILLRYYKGRTQTEISRIMGISQAQVSRLEKGALAYIREFVEP